MYTLEISRFPFKKKYCFKSRSIDKILMRADRFISNHNGSLLRRSYSVYIYKKEPFFGTSRDVKKFGVILHANYTRYDSAGNPKDE